MKQPIRFPKHAYLPLLAVILFNSATYFGTRLFLSEARFYSLETSLDRILPFVPFFSLFYVLAYLQWGLNYWLHAYTGKEHYYHLCTADLIAKLICFVCFLAFPVTIVRPEITGNDVFSKLTALIYSIDSPTNLFPSIHCLESWIAFRAARAVKNAPAWYAPIQLILTLLVFASTVLLKQHYLADILGGLLAVEVGWFLSKKLHLWRIFERLEPSTVKKTS